MDTIRIVLADDHALIRAGIRNTLAQLSNLEIVGEVGDGPGLFATLSETQPDCLLMDVTMPDFEPLSAIHQIRKQYPDLKILVVSAYDDDVYVQGLLREGVNGYFLKSQPLSDLHQALQRVLAGEKWVSGSLVERLVSYTDRPPPTPLTARQREILRLLHQGLDNQSIAQHLNLSIKTVENHLTRLYRQLNVQSRLEAVSFITQHPQLLALSGQEATLKPTAETYKQGRVKILLVDDNARYRQQLQRTIGRVCPPATIYEAQNIKESVKYARDFQPDLILVDVILGEEDGVFCTRRIKAVSPGSRIILISAYPDREFHRRGLEAGAIAFLDKKALNTTTLRQIIDDLTS